MTEDTRPAPAAGKAARARAALLALPRPVQGMALMLFSSFVFTAGNAVIRHLSHTLPPVEIVFFRSLFSLAILFPLALQAGPATLRTSRLPLHLARGAIQAVSMMMFFQGVASIPLVEVNALEFTAPLFATIIAVLFFGERLKLRRTLALIVGFIGALVALRPGFDTISVGHGLILGSAFVWAWVLIAIRALSTTESSLTQSVYMGLALTPVSGLAAAFVWVWPSWTELAWLALLTTTATIGQLAYVEAFRRAEMSAVLPLDYSKLIWSAALGFVLFAEIPDLAAIAGGTVIFAAGAYITLREAQIARRPPPPASEPL